MHREQFLHQISNGIVQPMRKEEPLVGWRKEGATDLKPLAKQGGGEEEAEEVWVARL